MKDAEIVPTVKVILTEDDSADEIICNVLTLVAHLSKSGQSKLEQLERLRSEDTPRCPMITHTIDQFILNPKSILLTSSYQIPSQNKVKAEKLEKLVKNWNCRILL